MNAVHRRGISRAPIRLNALQDLFSGGTVDTMTNKSVERLALSHALTLPVLRKENQK